MYFLRWASRIFRIEYLRNEKIRERTYRKEVKPINWLSENNWRESPGECSVISLMKEGKEENPEPDGSKILFNRRGFTK